MNILSELKPEEVFGFFEKICAIPRGSGNTAMTSITSSATMMIQSVIFSLFMAGR